MYVSMVHDIQTGCYWVCGVHFTLGGAQQYMKRAWTVKRCAWKEKQDGKAWEHHIPKYFTFTIEKAQVAP
jgi:hypothetical protein